MPILNRPLGERARTLFRARLQKEQPELFDQVPVSVWEKHWNVGCQAAGSGENALRYLSRYVFKTATANRPVPVLPDGPLQWIYRDSRTRRFTSIQLRPLEFVRCFLQHVLPRGFARVRTFGWLHPAAKVRGNRVRALLRQAPLLTPEERQTWQPPVTTATATVPTPGSPKVQAPCAPRCPRCQSPMRLVGSWHAGQVVLYPKRPP